MQTEVKNKLERGEAGKVALPSASARAMMHYSAEAEASLNRTKQALSTNIFDR